jgi:polysaccharide deacetylase family protein (PEP-CTERM system associated)
MPVSNALTIDVEDYFQVSAFAPYVDRASWDKLECRVEMNIEFILEILEHAQVKATFFTLGWIAERYPGVVRSIVSRGHELASHGYGHQRVSELAPSEFLADIVESKNILEDISGAEVKGYRAPSFSIGEGNLWAFDSLQRAGYRYSSSIYPIEHDHYGMPNAPRFPYYPRDGFLEIPISTLRIGNKNFPSSGGGYFRLFPYMLSRWMIGRINSLEKRPAIFYFHPWELDVAQPRIAGVSHKARFRHYVNIATMEIKLKALLSDFKWNRMDRIFLDDLKI